MQFAIPSLSRTLSIISSSTAILIAATSLGQTVSIDLKSPVDFQVIQRDSQNLGKLSIRGTLSESLAGSAHIQMRLTGSPGVCDWTEVMSLCSGSQEFQTSVTAPAGGWYRLELRVAQGDQIVAHSEVEHVGVGDIFVIAGQSNSANHGEVKTSPSTHRIVTYYQGTWKLAEDPQPGASGGGGSFIPSFGDALALKTDLPVGIVATGVGATSVREWLPEGVRIPNPPTLTGNVRQLDSGEWESRGGIYKRFVERCRELGPNGFKAVLWHQGESDANQRDTSRTLPGDMYTKFMEHLILESRKEIGWEAPWLVAQASYHTPDDPGSEDIRNAQAALWKSGVAIQGPNTDELTGDYRDGGGMGVHFSEKGLKKHGELWAESVLVWMGK